MNIWCPYPNFKANTDVLRDEELWSCLYVALDVLRQLLHYKTTTGRLVQLWGARPGFLLSYAHIVADELERRGHKRDPGVTKAFVYMLRETGSVAAAPPTWWGEPRFHLAHRSRLIAVAPTYYAQRMPPTTPLDLPLMWPKKGILIP